MHAVAHFLNSEFFYDNTDLEFDFEVTNGLFECIKKLIPQFDVQQKILTELHLYKIGVEHFDSDFAMTQKKIHSPSKKFLPNDKFKYYTIFLCINVIIHNSKLCS